MSKSTEDMIDDFIAAFAEHGVIITRLSFNEAFMAKAEKFSSLIKTIDEINARETK